MMEKPGFFSRYWKAVVAFFGSGGATSVAQIAFAYFPPPGMPPLEIGLVYGALNSLVVGLITAGLVAYSAANAVTAGDLVAAAEASPQAKREIKTAAARVSGLGAALLLAVVMAGSVVGCAYVPGRGVVALKPNPVSPTQLVSAAQVLYAQVVTAAAEASEAGLLSEKTEARIDAIVDRVDAALTNASTAAQGGACTDPGSDPSVGQQLLACWQKWLRIAEAGITEIRLRSGPDPVEFLLAPPVRYQDARALREQFVGAVAAESTGDRACAADSIAGLMSVSGLGWQALTRYSATPTS